MREDTARYQRFARALMERGVRVIERGLWYVSTVHADAEVEETLAAVREVLSVER